MDYTGGNLEYAVGFSIGNKGYIGLGLDSNFVYRSDFWEYDPLLNNWTQKASFPAGGREQAVGFSVGQYGYVGTGFSSSGAQNDFWQYDPASNSWLQKSNFPGMPRGTATGFGTASKGYLGTGDNSGNPLADFWEYNPATDTWTQKADFGGGTREQAVSFSIGTKGYLGTGYSGGLQSDFWEYNTLTNTWSQKADCGGGSGRSLAVGFSIGPKGYIGTGIGGINFFEYDTVANAWTQIMDYAGGQIYNAVGFSIGNAGYVGTGRNGIGVQREFWKFGYTVTWEGVRGGVNDDKAISVDVTADSGFIFAGNSFNTVTSSDHIFLNKTDRNGTLEWTRMYGVGSYNEDCYSVKQTSDGGYVITGWTHSFGSSGSGHVFLIKTDGLGNLLWEKVYGGTTSAYDGGYSVIETSDGGYMVAGFTQSFGAGGSDFYLIKTDNSGNVQWTRTYGDSDNDKAYSVRQTLDGGYIIAGGYTLPATVQEYGLMIKVDASGVIQWGDLFDIGNAWTCSAVETQFGDFLFVGTTCISGAGGCDIFLARTDAFGNVIWKRNYGGSNTEYGCAVVESEGGGCAVSGMTFSFGAGSLDYYLIKTDIWGWPLWSNTFGGTAAEDGYCDVKQCPDHGYVLAGSTASFGAGGTDMFVIKTDPQGISCGNTLPPTIVNTDATSNLQATNLVTSSGGVTTSVSYSDFTGPWGNFDCTTQSGDDAGIKTITQPGSFLCSGTSNIQLLLHNYGMWTLSNCAIYWSVNGISQQPYYWSGSIAPGAELSVSPGSYFFAAGTSRLSAYADIPNGNYDWNHSNDFASVDITIYASPTVVISGDTNICSGETTTLSVPSIFSTYAWSPGNSTSPSVTVSTPGTYSVAVHDTNGCVGGDAVTLVVNANPTVSPTATPNLICQGSSTTLAANATAGSGTISNYSWSSGLSGNVSGGSVSPSTSTSYSVTVTNSNSCTSSGSINVTVNTPATVSAGSNQSICSGETANLNGSLGGSATSATWSTSGSGSFNNNNPNAVYTPSAADTAANSVTLTYTTNDPSGPCPAVNSFMTLSIYPKLSLNFSTVPSGCGQSNGSATVTVTGGGGNYTYLWDTLGTTTATISNMPAGIRHVTVSDGNGCSIDTLVAISNSSGPTASIQNQTNVTCAGGSNGAATITASGGTGALTYQWSPIGGTSNSATNLPAGNYNVTVSDGLGCQVVVPVTITEPPQLFAQVGNDTSLCIGNSMVIGDPATGGSPAYNYSWNTSQWLNDSAVYNPTSTPLTDITYKLTVTDANGCTANDSISITVLALPQESILIDTPRCENTPFNLQSTGFPSYSFLWSNGSTTQILAMTWPVGLDSVAVTVTDLNGCSNTFDTTFQVNALPAVQATQLHPGTVCQNSVDSLIATGADSYLWQSGDTAAMIAHVFTLAGADTFFVTGIDANGCSNSDTLFVMVNPQPEIDSITSVDPTSCTVNDGYFILHGLIANTSYTVYYSLGIQNITATVTADLNGTIQINNLDAGTYANIFVEQASTGCHSDTVSSVSLIDVGATPTILTADDDVLCKDSTILLHVAGGAGSTYDLYSPDGILLVDDTTGTDLSIPNANLTGFYLVEQTDLNSCKSVDSAYIIVSSPSVHITASPPSVCAGTTVHLSSDSVLQSYHWNPGNVLNQSFDTSPNTTTAFVLIGTDSIGCVDADTFTVIVNPVYHPVVTIMTPANDTVCLNEDIIFAPQILNIGPDSSCQWYLNGDLLPGETDWIFSTNQLQDYDTVSVIIHSNDSCTSDAMGERIMRVIAKPQIGNATSVDPSCGGNDGSIVLLNVSPANSDLNVSYFFNGNPQSVTAHSAGNGTLIISNLVAGTYTQITIGIGACSSDTVPGPITLSGGIVSQLPSSITAEDGIDPFCNFISNICFSATPANAAVTYQWSIVNDSTGFLHESPDGSIAVFSPPVVAVDQSYVIQLISSAGACSDTLDTTVAISTATTLPPPADIVLHIVNGFYTLIYTDHMADHYQWGYDSVNTWTSHVIDHATFQDYIVGTTLDTNIHYYWVKVDYDDCRNKIYYNAPYARAIPSPPIADHTSIYPNPNGGIFTLSFDKPITGKLNIEISNQLGQVMLKKEMDGRYLPESTVLLDFSNHPDAVYFVRIWDDLFDYGAMRFIKCGLK